MGCCFRVTRPICAIMLMRRLLIVLLFAGATSPVGNVVVAQSFPARPIRIVTSDAGGGSDIVARAIAQGISVPFGQPVIVENRAGGVIAGEAVSKAPADGYTLLYFGNALWLLPLLRANVPYDAVRDFVPITLGVIAPGVLTVHPPLPARSVKELVALGKARPGQLNYGSSAIGTSNHLAAELFKSMAKVNFVRIGYKGGGAMLNDLVAGQIQLAFGVMTSMMPQVKAGRLRALGVTSLQRASQVPDVPTIAEAGLPGYESLSITGMFAPAKTPEPIINRLNHEIVQVLHRPDVKTRFLDIGVEPIGSSPEQFAAKIRSEIVKWGKIIKEAGIREE